MNEKKTIQSLLDWYLNCLSISLIPLTYINLFFVKLRLFCSKYLPNYSIFIGSLRESTLRYLSKTIYNQYLPLSIYDLNYKEQKYSFSQYFTSPIELLFPTPSFIDDK